MAVGAAKPMINAEAARDDAELVAQDLTERVKE